MAVMDSHEQEQLESIKEWWNDNGSQFLTILLIASIALAGWRGWQYYQHKQMNDSATLYQQFVEQMASNDARRINDAAAVLMDKYAATPYAPRAALLAAQVNEEGKEPARAKNQLQWVVEHSKEAGLKNVADLRLASILLDEKDFAGALKVLNNSHAASFDALYEDLKGDVLYAQGKPVDARAAYQLSFDKLDIKSSYRNLVQMKLDALGGIK
jgi:predicted negative regulator of RcsB-dependent stress response